MALWTLPAQHWDEFAETAAVSAPFLARLGNTSASVLKVTWKKEQRSGDGITDNEEVIGVIRSHVTGVFRCVCVPFRCCSLKIYRNVYSSEIETHGNFTFKIVQYFEIF